MLIGLFIQLLLLNDYWHQPPPKVVYAYQQKTKDSLINKKDDFFSSLFVNKLPKAQIRKGREIMRKKNSNSLGIDVTADYVAVIDSISEQVLFQKNADMAVPIASITKLMTSLVFLDTNPDWKSIITMKKEDERRGGRFHIFRGEKIRLKDLFYVALIASDNNAIMALVRSTGLRQQQFVDKMNEKAISLGLSSTHFVEPTGLSAGNVASAFDLVKLLKEAHLKEMLRKITTLSKYSFLVRNKRQKRVVFNTNRLLGGFLDKSPYSIETSKTGYIVESGYNLSAYIHNKKENASIIAVVLSSATHSDRFSDLKALTLWAFDNFEWK